jgi:hypothetical protein
MIYFLLAICFTRSGEVVSMPGAGHCFGKGGCHDNPTYLIADSLVGKRVGLVLAQTSCKPGLGMGYYPMNQQIKHVHVG